MATYLRNYGIDQQTVDRLVYLLRETDLTIAELAQRFRCSKSTVLTMNRKYKVRAYQGLRSRWTFHPSNSLEDMAVTSAARGQNKHAALQL